MEHTFTLSITDANHGEWQGRVAKANGESADFQSLLELVKIIKSNMEEEV